LLLAILDDAIGLIIIAVFYPDPLAPVRPAWLLAAAAGMGASYLLRRGNTRSYWPYLFLGGVPSWVGLSLAHLHPALALVFVVPFLPHPRRETGHLFEEDPRERSPLARFEQEWRVIVDFGLFFFGLANAGVPLSGMGTGTWLVLSSLVLGKTLGIFAFGLLGHALGFSLPRGMGGRELLVTGLIAGIGFTVSLFIAGQAFADPALQAEAKMGAVLSLGVAAAVAGAGRAVGIRRR
ncbi:MAG: Na+/H+ antiporter NhaA, partial [Deltaproteobacteria bacterium]|nr:Na+/H+ antiporter NhaA [Deltaproteobacteria bacterium]